MNRFLDVRCGVVAFLVLAGGIACSSDPDAAAPRGDSGAGTQDAGPGRFSAVDEAALAALSSAQTAVPGFSVSVYNSTNQLQFEKNYGSFDPDRRVAVASASKMASGLILLRLVDRGLLSLDSTTGQVLGWTGPNASIKLSHLMSFTSGLPAEADCTRSLTMSLAECVNAIAALAPVSAAGSSFYYGSTHLQVAGRMAEVATGKSWDALVQDELRAPLGLPAEFRYYTAPRQALGTRNPLVAGGLQATAHEYAKVLAVVSSKGVSASGTRLAASSWFEVQGRMPYPDAANTYSPFKAAVNSDYRYGLTAWLECNTPASGCEQLSSPGAFGFTPWVDRSAGYYAVLGTFIDSTGNGDVVSFSIELEQKLQPLIRAALSPLP